MGDVHPSPRVSSDYVDALETERAALVAALAPVVTERLVDAAHREAARRSVRLDASPLEDATADAVDRGTYAGIVRAPAEGTGGRGSGWAQALRLDGMPTQDIAAVEYRAVRAAQAEEPRLAGQLFDAPMLTLVELHRHIAAGLIDDDRLGALRRTSRAVHDGAQGMVIFQSPDPARLPALLDGLGSWVADARGTVTPLALAGVIHAQLLHWRPFEAGNGRVARAASRVALRAGGGDPWGLAVPEQVYAGDPLHYMRQVAATVRRRGDLRPWIEYTGEAAVTSLERLARRAGVAPPTRDVRSERACANLGAGDTLTVTEFAAALDATRRDALHALAQLCWRGLLRRDPTTRGLRYVRTDAPLHAMTGADADRSH